MAAPPDGVAASGRCVLLLHGAAFTSQTWVDKVSKSTQFGCDDEKISLSDYCIYCMLHFEHKFCLCLFKNTGIANLFFCVFSFLRFILVCSALFDNTAFNPCFIQFFIKNLMRIISLMAANMQFRWLVTPL